VENLSEIVERKGEDRVIIIISTVLPGTIRKHVLPKLSGHIKLCYNPFFIAMGTTIRDFYHPEFILFGVHDNEAAKKAKGFYETITDAPFYSTSIENAEMIKVSYNTYIGMKIVFANTIMEVCHKLPYCDVDVVTNALSLAGRRLMSGAYLHGGMGDGGGCHPRDNIALSWLAGELKLKHDFFADIMHAREDQTDWLADLIMEYEGDKVILGKSFKPETNLTVGSPSILLCNLLKERNVEVQMWDPHVDGQAIPEFAKKKAVYFIGTRHIYFQTFTFPKSSIVLDPFRYIANQTDVQIIRIGSAETACV
jgi:UDPglucose 6-dehydrogenase